MERDLLLILGLAMVPLAGVAFVSAWADRRRPWPGLILLGMALVMVGGAVLTHPEGGYDWRAVPQIGLELLARLLN